MTVIRAVWMRNMVRRDNRFMDGQLLAQALNSASFFASSNLLLIAGGAGALFGGEATFRHVSSLEVIRTSSRLLFEGQLALVLVALSRGLLDFIWSIRQMNYCIAAIGAVPVDVDEAHHEAFGAVTARMLNPALSSFNAGVRGILFRPGGRGLAVRTLGLHDSHLGGHRIAHLAPAQVAGCGGDPRPAPPPGGSGQLTTGLRTR